MISAFKTRNAFRCPIRTDWNHRGFTLVELMVAMTIGLIILAAVAQIFATSRGTYGLQEGMARVQEGGRFGMEFLATDIRMAGYAGCNSDLKLGAPDGSGNCGIGTVCNIVKSPKTPEIFNPNGIQGHAYTGTGTALSDWTPALPSDYFSAGEVKAGSDVIIIQRVSTTGAKLTGNPTPINANIQISKSESLCSLIAQNDVLMLSDCKSGDVFKVTNTPNCNGSGNVTIVHAASGNIQPKLTHTYGNDAELFKLVSRAYYIGTGASGEPALFRKELATGGSITTQELIEGVEEMRIRYGEDTDTSTPTDKVANIYRAANNVSNWSRIASVRVGLLVRTPANVDTELDPKTYPIAGVSVGPFNDKRRRHGFTSTVEVRNYHLPY